MTKFDVVRSIYGVKEFSNLMFWLAQDVGSQEKLAELLAQEVPEEVLQFICSVAPKYNYPISFSGLQ